MNITATYSPEDNKIRLTTSERLPAELYTRVRAHGFIWAPRQGIFVAPTWTPDREDFAVELAGEIGDEDTTLVERAEERAERFEDYSDKREREANSAHANVERIAGRIPFGQPIMIGHHSERRARKDAEKIQDGMRRAVRMWETSQYWERRAAGAIATAKYKEIPEVRARRIKGLESDRRKQLEYISRAELFTKLWEQGKDQAEEGVQILTQERAETIANRDRVCSSKCFPLAEFPRDPPASQYEGAMGLWSALTGGIITPEQAREFALRGHAGTIAWATRWLNHFENRLTYERAMLAEGGGLIADKHDIQPGGKVSRRGTWFVVIKVNRRDGAAISVTVAGHWKTTMGIEEVTDYQPPAEGEAEQVAAAMKAPPLVNYKAPGAIEMTMADWKKKASWGDRFHVSEFNENHTMAKRGQIGEGKAVYRQRATSGGASATEGRYYTRVHVFITDAKETKPPTVAAEKPKLPARPANEPRQYNYQAPEQTKFDLMKQSLKTGVQVITAPQLFPTPHALAQRMADLANVREGMEVLEPSAGTGRLAEAILANGGNPFMVEINGSLCESLARRFDPLRILQGDFLEQNGNLGKFDVILMNPPFENAVDIKHIQHARTFLKPGGTLVSICANGPRQRDTLMDLAEHWEDLPAGTFESAGTGVNTAMVVIRG